MKAKLLFTISAASLMTVVLASPLQAQQQSIFESAGAEPKFKPGDFKPAPEKIKTRFGTLKFTGGYPTEKTAQKVYDELDLQRAALEVGHLLYDVGCRQAGKACIFRAACPFSTMTGTASANVWLSATRNNLRHGRMLLRMPVW